jgi:hypothetical protein
MNKEKLKHLPISLIFHILDFACTFMMLTTWAKFDMIIAGLISFWCYVLLVMQSVTNGYLEERVRKLENELKHKL